MMQISQYMVCIETVARKVLVNYCCNNLERRREVYDFMETIRRVHHHHNKVPLMYYMQLGHMLVRYVNIEHQTICQCIQQQQQKHLLQVMHVTLLCHLPIPMDVFINHLLPFCEPCVHDMVNMWFSYEEISKYLNANSVLLTIIKTYSQTYRALHYDCEKWNIHQIFANEIHSYMQSHFAHIIQLEQQIIQLLSTNTLYLQSLAFSILHNMKTLRGEYMFYNKMHTISENEIAKVHNLYLFHLFKQLESEYPKLYPTFIALYEQWNKKTSFIQHITANYYNWLYYKLKVDASYHNLYNHHDLKILQKYKNTITKHILQVLLMQQKHANVNIKSLSNCCNKSICVIM